MPHDVFISYSTKDKHTADAICHVLEQNNLKCWIAPRNIVSGKSYSEEIMVGLKTAKIVVLVFSKNSQESVFVNREIDTAFRNNKPIISFKIDETMPEKNMEYYLKNKHWLEAYPHPEKEFKTLIKDALRLCDEEYSVDLINDNVGSNKNTNKLPTRNNDLISFIALFTPLYPISFIYMGVVAKIREWLIYGLICIVPVILLFLYTGSPVNYQLAPKIRTMMIVWVILWGLSIVYGFFIRKEFLARKTVLNLMSKDDSLFEDLVKEYARM